MCSASCHSFPRFERTGTRRVSSGLQPELTDRALACYAAAFGVSACSDLVCNISRPSHGWSCVCRFSFAALRVDDRSSSFCRAAPGAICACRFMLRVSASTTCLFVCMCMLCSMPALCIGGRGLSCSLLWPPLQHCSTCCLCCCTMICSCVPM